MRVIAFCGPIGAPIKELVSQLPATTVIDETEHLEEGKLSLNVESLLVAIDSQKADIVVVTGHTLYTYARLRNKFDMKVFVDTDKDTCLINYLKEGNLDTYSERMTKFINSEKPKNDQQIYPTKQYADIVIPFKKINGPIVALLATAFNTEFKNTQEEASAKTPGFWRGK